MSKLTDRIKHLKPCGEATTWLAEQKSAAQAWRDCQCGDWMLWLIGKLTTSKPWSEDRKPLLACCLDIADTVKHLRTKKYDEKIAAAIMVLRRWIKGEAAIDEAMRAREDLLACWGADAAAAYAADAAAVYAAYAAYAADAAVYAAYAAVYAAYAAYAADAAVYAADAAVYAAYAAYARAKSLATYADIVRQYFPKPPTIKQRMAS